MKEESAKLVRCKVDVSEWFIHEKDRAKMRITSPSGKTITIHRNVENRELTLQENVLLTIAGECREGKGIFTYGQMTMLLNISKKACSRFVLRDRAELVRDHGKEYFDLLIQSLTDYFQSVQEVKEYPADGEIMIMVPSSFPNSEIDFQFTLHSKKFDVYNLEFIGSIG